MSAPELLKKFETQIVCTMSKGNHRSGNHKLPRLVHAIPLNALHTRPPMQQSLQKFPTAKIRHCTPRIKGNESKPPMSQNKNSM